MKRIQCFTDLNVRYRSGKRGRSLSSDLLFHTLYEHKACFSLIELLITIAVIAILAGLLLPALNAAREKAIAINCVSNLKQVSTCNAIYTADFNGYFPPPFTKRLAGTSKVNWMAVVGYHTVYAKTHTSISNVDLDIYWNEYKKHKKAHFWACPHPSAYRIGDRLMPLSYGLRIWGEYNVEYSTVMDYFYRFGNTIRVVNNSQSWMNTDYKIPSQMVFIGDSAQGGQIYGSSILNDSFSAVSSIFITRHGNSGGVLFGDGHAGLQKGAQLNDEKKKIGYWPYKNLNGDRLN